MNTLHYIFNFMLVVYVNPHRIGEGVYVSDPTKFPFFAMFINETRSGGMKYQLTCGSSLIHPEWILTAGHCVPKDTSQFAKLIRSNQDMIFMGAVYIPQLMDPDQARQIVEIHRHPDYFLEEDPNHPGVVTKLLNDVALIKVNKPFMLSHRVQVIHLSTSFSKCVYGLTMGIGDTDYNNPLSGAAILKYAKLIINAPAPDSKTAFYAFSEVKKKYNYTESGCALEGDSGGPFICENSSPPLQIGVISGGIYLNSSNIMANRIERVDYFIDFIKQHLPKDKYTQYLENPRKMGTFRKGRNNAKRSSGTLLYLFFFLFVYWLEK